MFPCSVATLILCTEPSWSPPALQVKCVFTALGSSTELTKGSCKNPSSVFTFCLPSRLGSFYLIVHSLAAASLARSIALFIISRSLSYPRYAPFFLIFRNEPKHVINHVSATAVILPTYLILLGPVFQIEPLLH